MRDVPYDRARTTMAGFAMCDACRAEYEDPRDRRFHAEPNACPACGPRARLDGAARPTGADPVAAAAALLRDGAIVAVKGIGGYHLACRADDEAAVAALRARKHREDRPFALMAGDLGAARALVALSPRRRGAAVGPRPADRDRAAPPHATVARAVAPGAHELGVMLPYSPLHHLLARDAGVPLVMTSGNVSDEPIAYADDDALERLAGIADRFLVHDRPIETRTDDSVLRGPIVLRRSRGRVPARLALPVPSARPLLACGAELKSTFCLARDGHAWVGHHIGDLRNWETLHSFRAGIAHFERLFAVTPEVVAHDLHPDYLSTAYAHERADVELVAVQHHHAHLAACLAEHGVDGPAVGAIFDGAGLGPDGTVWGGELLVGGLDGYERLGHLWPVRLPGGDAAAREPWRMACAWGQAAGAGLAAPPGVAPERWEAVARLARRGGGAAPETSSAGRLFDAVAALCGLRRGRHLRGPSRRGARGGLRAGRARRHPLPVVEADGRLLLDARATVTAVVADLRAGTPPGIVATRFHNALAEATARACALLAERRGLDTVVLSGGVFQNRLLLERTRAPLDAAGLRVLVPERLPPNDGGISFGQAAIAARSL